MLFSLLLILKIPSLLNFNPDTLDCKLHIIFIDTLLCDFFCNIVLMNIWQHCLLSQRKFGGIPEDYASIHSFIDSSKLYFYHIKHRSLLHNLYGVELCIDLFGNFVKNTDNQSILVRDIAAEHCREDLDGKIPTLYEWFVDNPEMSLDLESLPTLNNPAVNHFLRKPFLRSGLSASLRITFSDFGVHLLERFFGLEAAAELAQKIPQDWKIKSFLSQFRFTQTWQYTPQVEELKWLRKQEREAKL